MLIEATNVSVALAGRRVVDSVGLSLGPGEIVGLLGPNGAGKSTLIRALAGQLPFEGEIRLDGRGIGTLPLTGRARLLAHLPQGRIIGWPLPVESLVGLGRMPWQGIGRAFSARDRALVAEAMAMMDVSALAGRAATDLSGGEQARVLAARAIAQDTPLLLADEPASGLDPAHQMTLMAGLRRLAANGRAVLVSLHDLTLAARWCDRLLVLKGGRLAAEGKPAEVMTAATLRDVFGIEAHIASDGHGLVVAPLSLAAGRGP